MRIFKVSLISVLLAIFLITNGQFHIRHASYVQGVSGTSGTGSSGTCTFSSNVTSGDIEVAAVFLNTAIVTTVTSTRVSSWVLGATTNHLTFYYGVAASTGTETVTINLNSSSALGVACGEWNTSTLDQLALGNPANTISITTTRPVSDIVCAGAAGGGGPITLNSPFTTRVTTGSTLVLGDQQVTSTGTYQCIVSATFPYMTEANFYTPGGVVMRRR